MSGSDNNPQTTQSTQTNKPWSEQAPYLKAGMHEAADLYAKGKGGAYYPGATYLGPTDIENDAFRQIINTAQSGNPLLRPSLNNAEEMIRSGGLTEQQRQAGGYLGRIASGQNNIGTGDLYRDLYRQSGQDSVSQRGLIDTAMGRNIGENNQYLMQNLDRSAGKAGQAVNSAMGGLGRFGGGSHQGILAREVGDLYSRGLGEQMNQDLNRQMAAAGQIDAQSNAQMAARQGALAGLTGVQGANIANQAAAAQGVNSLYGEGANRALAYTGMMPQLGNARYSDANVLMQAGAARRGELQDELQENVNRWNSEQNRPWEQLARYMQFTSGVIPSGYGTTTSQVPQGSRLAGILGGALGGGALGAQAGGGWGALLGSLLGGGAGAFA